MSEWKKSQGTPPNLEGTQLGDLLEKLGQLVSHYEGALEVEQKKLDHLESLKNQYTAQHQKRRVDPNG
jgi:hypothetical protein